MRIYIIRHAQAEDVGEGNWKEDSQRRLTAEGTKRFSKLVTELRERGFHPRQIATSPLVRCVQTAEILRQQLQDATLTQFDALAPGSSLEPMLRWTAQQKGDVAWVGHAPDVGEMTAALIGQTESQIHFSKGAVAAIEFEVTPAPAAGSLAWLVTPKLLGV
jgi:phosphohistidine phosphatase